MLHSGFFFFIVVLTHASFFVFFSLYLFTVVVFFFVLLNSLALPKLIKSTRNQRKSHGLGDSPFFFSFSAHNAPALNLVNVANLNAHLISVNE